MSSEIIKVVVVIIISAVLIIALRTKLAEYAFLLIIATVIVVLLVIMSVFSDAITQFRDMLGKIENANVYFTTAIKVLGISYIVTFTADMCRDFGLSALAQTAEITGKIAIFILSLPLVTALLDTALKFIGL